MPRTKLRGKEQQVIDAYLGGLSLTQVGSLVGVTAASVSRLLARSNIPARTISEGTALAFTKERREQASLLRRGKPSFTLGKRFKLRHIKQSPKIRGANNPNWKGGITAEHFRIRNSPEYKAWRVAVFERDGYTCQECGTRSCAGNKVHLHADHIKPFSTHPALRLDTNNGRTLCKPCHKQTPTYGVNARYAA